MHICITKKYQGEDCFMIYNPILGNTMQSINMSMLFFIYLFKKNTGSATVSTPFKWHHKRSNIYWVMEHAGTAGWIEEVCILINYLLIDQQNEKN